MFFVSLHKIQSMECTCLCGCHCKEQLPLEATAPVSYGPNVHALVGYMSTLQSIPFKRMVDIFNNGSNGQFFAFFPWPAFACIATVITMSRTAFRMSKTLAKKIRPLEVGKNLRRSLMDLMMHRDCKTE